MPDCDKKRVSSTLARARRHDLLEAVAVRIERGRDPKEAATFLVEQGCKNARRVEFGKAHEIDGAVQADERDRVQVADDAVILDRLRSRLFVHHVVWLAFVHRAGR